MEESPTGRRFLAVVAAGVVLLAGIGVAAGLAVGKVANSAGRLSVGTNVPPKAWLPLRANFEVTPIVAAAQHGGSGQSTIVFLLVRSRDHATDPSSAIASSFKKHGWTISHDPSGSGWAAWAPQSLTNYPDAGITAQIGPARESKSLSLLLATLDGHDAGLVKLALRRHANEPGTALVLVTSSSD